MTTLELPEWGDVRAQEGALVEAAGRPMPEVAHALSALVDVSASWSTEVVLRSRRRVGELQIGRLLVRVTPRASMDALLGLLSWTVGARIGLSLTPLGAHGQRAFTLRDALAAGYVLEVESLLTSDLHRAYQDQQSRLLTLRGRPRFDRLGAKPPATGLPCRYTQMTRNTLPHQLLFGAMEQVVGILSGTDWERRAREVSRTLAGLVSRPAYGAQQFAWAGERLGQRHGAYRTALSLARMLLHGGGPVTVTGKGGTTGWWVDMPTLFERAVTRGVRAWAERRGLRLEAQKTSRGAILDGAWEPYQETRPDMELWDREVRVAVLDAKYKPYLEANPETGAPQRRVDREDLYQLAFYARDAPRVFLIAPEYDAPGVDPRYRTLHMGAASLELIGVRFETLPERGELAIGV